MIVGTMLSHVGRCASTSGHHADAHRPTWLNMVPTIIAYLINAAGADTGKRFESVRFGRSASAPLPPEQHRAFEARFGIGVVEAMGMTESSSVMLCNPQDPHGARSARRDCPAASR